MYLHKFRSAIALGRLVRRHGFLFHEATNMLALLRSVQGIPWFIAGMHLVGRHFPVLCSNRMRVGVLISAVCKRNLSVSRCRRAALPCCCTTVLKQQTICTQRLLTENKNKMVIDSVSFVKSSLGNCVSVNHRHLPLRPSTKQKVQS